MNYIKLALILAVVLSVTTHAADDLKTYYEKQKAELAPTFEAPQLGSQVTVKTAAGQSRTGILMKLDALSISLMTDTGNVSYKRMALHETSRAQFFAEDFAHVKALEMTRLYKDELHKENVAERAAGIHAGTLYISAKVDKDSDKKVEKKENENKRTGEKRESSITTRTYSETQVLNIGVANTTTHSDRYTVEYFFFYKTVSSDNDDKKKKEKEPEADVKEYKNVRLLDKGSKSVTVDAKRRETISITSEPCVVEKVETTSSSGYSSNRGPRVSGRESAGYLVLLRYGSEILDKKASAKSYLDDEWVNKFK
ncbi:hypothetical protein P4B35_00150 [Pontiellaceae bacterium B12227]|nr:hypothetical protein [Pontiellaceae bacterium B12227]